MYDQEYESKESVDRPNMARAAEAVNYAKASVTSQVPMTLERQNNILQELDELVGLLTERLSPIYRDGATMKQHEDPDREPMVPIAEVIERHNGRVSDVNERLRSLLDGVQV